MAVGFNVYVLKESWLHSMDPRVKLVFVGGSLITLLVYKNLYFMATVFLIMIAVHLSSRIPIPRILFVLRTLLPISILIASLWIVFYPIGEPIASIWFIQITPIGIAQGMVLAFRILNMALVIFAWLYTTEQTSVVRSFVKFRMPYDWGLVLALALRYIPTFQSMYSVVSEAQQARGLVISGAGFRRLRIMMPIFVSMIISAFRSSDQLAKALDARAFGLPDVQRTYFKDIHFRPLDWVYTVVLIFLFINLLYLNLRFGFGTLPVNPFPINPLSV